MSRSENTSWYKGLTLMETLETVEINADINFEDGRFPVQRVIRPQSEKFHDFRGFAGKVEGGVFKVGDSITALPSGTSSTIKDLLRGKRNS